MKISFLKTLMEHVGFGDRVAEHVVADGGDAIGGVGGAEDDRLGGLGDRVGGLGRVRQRRAEDHQDVVLEDQLLEDVDGFFLLALFVLDHQHDLVAADAAGGVDFIGSQLEAVADRRAYWAAPPDRASAQLEVGRVGSRNDTGRDQRGQQLLVFDCMVDTTPKVCLGMFGNPGRPVGQACRIDGGCRSKRVRASRPGILLLLYQAERRQTARFLVKPGEIVKTPLLAECHSATASCSAPGRQRHAQVAVGALGQAEPGHLAVAKTHVAAVQRLEPGPCRPVPCRAAAWPRRPRP